MEDVAVSSLASGGSYVVRGLPKFDVEGYISNYSGRTRIDRLFYIAQHCPSLAVESYKHAIKLLKEGIDVPRYKKAVEALAEIAPEAPEARYDDAWIDKTSKTVAQETEKYENQLKSYKANMIKESIRMGQEDLAKYLYQTGDLAGAFRTYSRMRDYCTTPDHVYEMTIEAIKISIQNGNYDTVQSQILRLRNLAKNSAETDMNMKFTIATALNHLHSARFEQASTTFLECQLEHSSSFTEIISPNDIAVYGGLTALARMDRASLKTCVLENQTFRSFLDLEPHIRRAIQFFCSAKYAQCLQILEDYKNDYLLDIYLGRHIEDIYKHIRRKSIYDYFVPFSCVSLKTMANALNTSVERLEKELEFMIMHKILDAKIDMEKQLLVSKQADTRTTVHKNTLRIAQNYEREARIRLLRMSIIKNGYKIKEPKQLRGWGEGEMKTRRTNEDVLF